MKSEWYFFVFDSRDKGWNCTMMNAWKKHRIKTLEYNRIDVNDNRVSLANPSMDCRVLVSFVFSPHSVCTERIRCRHILLSLFSSLLFASLIFPSVTPLSFSPSRSSHQPLNSRELCIALEMFGCDVGCCCCGCGCFHCIPNAEFAISREMSLF